MLGLIIQRKRSNAYININNYKEVIIIAKTQGTLDLEKQIWKATSKQGVFSCFEVTIGWWGKERCDFITFDTKSVWRCYEIKVSKSDFHSKAKKTFLGHYNYYVMPSKLYEEVKEEIPNHIGVYCGQTCVKRAKKQELGVDEQVLKNSMIRSLYREAEKLIKSEDSNIIDKLNRRIKYFERESNDYKNKYWELMRIGQEKYGTRWYKED
jgi:hypothetical protein